MREREEVRGGEKERMNETENEGESQRLNCPVLTK